jgi:hypothetical protein
LENLTFELPKAWDASIQRRYGHFDEPIGWLTITKANRRMSPKISDPALEICYQNLMHTWSDLGRRDENHKKMFPI